ncbi:MAG: radical SAM protein [Nanoarchaeota archaeon]|nr:radical SAM protein [Nanoarchaeota archaeon]
MNLLLQITKACNLQCRHCHDSCGPDRTSMDAETLEVVVGNIPQGAKQIIISGGEPLVKPKLFWHAMDCIAANRQNFPKAVLSLQTNGFWAKNTDAAYAILKQLYEKGLDRLVLTGLDKYHAEQGIDLSSLSETESPFAYAMQRLGTPFTVIREVDNQGIMPFGRAKDLPAEEQAKKSQCEVPWGFDNHLTVDTSGQLYPCCWKATPSMGSAKDKSIENILRNAKKNKIFHALERGGPKEAAIKLDIYREQDEQLYRHECRMCEEIFRGMK